MSRAGRLAAARLWLADRFRPSERQKVLFWAGAVGLAGGLVSVLFRRALVLAQWVFTGQGGSVVEAAAALPAWQRLLVPTLGGFTAGVVLLLGPRFARGEPSTDYLEAIALGSGVVPPRPSVVASTSSLFTIASGGSIGREGPMVQLSAMVASWLGRRVGFSTPRLRLLVACGAAAGIASAYNAPIAGSLFVAEILLGAVAMQSFGPLILASVVAAFTVRQLLGNAPVFAVPAFSLVSLWEIGPYVGLGLAAGLAVPWYLRVLRASERLLRAIPVPLPVRLAIGGAAVGALSIAQPYVWGNGYHAISSILALHWVWTGLLGLLAFKLLATAATVGSGAVGGVFTPTLFVGAVLGALVGEGVHAAWPGVTAAPQAYAVVGMAAFLAGATHAPLMAIVMLFEMTLDYDIILPLMLACVTAYHVAHALQPASLYTGPLARKGLTRLERSPTDLYVRDLMKPPPGALPVTAPFGAIVEAFAREPVKYLYVTDGGGAFLGAVALHDVKAHLADQTLADVVVAADLVRRDFPVCTPDQTLLEALARCAGHDGERVPVVADLASRRLVGVISKTDLLLTLSQGSQRII